MFSPLSIGAALGGFTSGFMDSQKQLQQRQVQQQAMQLNALRMKQAQQEQQAQSLAFPALLGLDGAGGGGAPQLPSGTAPAVPGGGGPPAGLDGGAQPPMPGASSQPGGGPKMSGASPNTPIADYIRQQAVARGLNPDQAIHTAMTEGGVGRFRLGDGGKSGGPFQLYTGGGLGNEFQQKTGLDPLRPENEKAGIDFALDYAKEHGGFSPNIWHGLRGGGGQGGGEASPQQIAHNAQRQIPPQQWGNLSIQQLAQSIERANPGADPGVKMMALETASKLLAPMQQQQWEQYKFGIEEQDKLRIHEDTLANQQLQREETSAFRGAMLNQRQQGQEEKGWQIQTLPDGRLVRVQTSTGKVEPLDVPAGTAKQGTGTQTVNPETQKMMADGIAKYQLPPLAGWALKSPAGQQIMANVLKQNPDYDATKFTGKQAGARSVGTRSAQLEMNTDVAEQEIPLTLETSRKIDRTEFPTINSMVIAVEKGTGNPDVVKFLDQLNALKYTYAAALSRTGTNTVDAMRRFDQILDPAWSQGQIEAALDQFKTTLGAERRGIDKSRGLGEPQGAPQPGTVQDGYRFKGGDPAQEGNWERVQ